MNSKFTTIFSSEVKALISEEKDKYLAMASLVDVGKFVPEIDTNKNIDLLPIAFNAFVANRVNKNGDVVDSSTALEIHKSFINKPINIEHNRSKVIGTILVAGFSEFGTDKPLTEEEVKDLKSPFNVALGAIVWKVVNSDVAKLIEDAGDPTSEFYQKISASWELGFEDYQLVILEGDDKNIENGEIITDKEKIEELKGNLKILGGEGKLEDGRMIYRQVISKVIPLGIGLTEKPAADVKGVAVKRSEIHILVKEKPSDDASEEISKKVAEVATENILEIEQKISQNNENNVIENKDSNMEIKSIKDITDKALEEVSASQISDFIEEELKKASEKFSENQSKVENALKKTKEEKEVIAESQKKLEEELTNVKSQLDTLEAEKIEREKIEQFNQRMASLDELFVLSDEEREVIASDIKELDDESFGGYQKKLSVLMNDKTKAAVEEAKKKESEYKKEEESKIEKTEASVEEEIVDEAIEQAEEEKDTVPVTIAAEEPSVYEKYKNAFSLENFEIKL